MRTLLLAFVVALQVSGETASADDRGKFTPVRVPVLLQKFVVADEATAFSIGAHKGADYAVAACDEKGRLSVAFIRSSGGGKVLTVEPRWEKPPRLLLADLDGDERAEVLVCSKRLRIYRIADDKLSLIWTSRESFDDQPAPRLGPADLDGDGRTDIAVLNYKPSKGGVFDAQSLYIYMNQTGGHLDYRLGGATTFTDEHGFHSTSGLAIGNFFGDERPEVVVGNDNGWLWLLRVRRGKPVVETRWKILSGGAIGPGLAAGNLDGTPEKELLVGTNGGDIFVYKFAPGGRPVIVAKAHAGRLAYGVLAGDLDGDGQDEFLLARGSLGYAGMTQKDVVTEIWKLSDDKLESIWRREAVGFKTPALKVQDFDRDGSMELVIYTPFGEGKSVEVVKPELNR